MFVTASAATLEMSQSVVGLFDQQGYDVPNYYVILSDQSSATYNQAPYPSSRVTSLLLICTMNSQTP